MINNSATCSQQDILILQMGLISRVLTNHRNVRHCNSTSCNRNSENVETLQSKRPFSVPLSESFFRYTKVKTTKPKSRKLSSFQKQRNQSKHFHIKNQNNANETEELKNKTLDKSTMSSGIKTHKFLSQNEQQVKKGKKFATIG